MSKLEAQLEALEKQLSAAKPALPSVPADKKDSMAVGAAEKKGSDKPAGSDKSAGASSAASKAARPPSFSASHCVELLLPDHVSAASIAYGGVIMSWIDITGGITAFKHTGGPVVTASVDQIHFLGPARLGEVITLHGRVLRSFSSSMEVRVIVEAEHITSGTTRRICDALLVFVALGPDFRPTEVVPVRPESAQEKLDFEESGARRELRAAWRASQSLIHKAVDEKKLSDAELGLLAVAAKAPAADGDAKEKTTTAAAAMDESDDSGKQQEPAKATRAPEYKSTADAAVSAKPATSSSSSIPRSLPPSLAGGVVTAHSTAVEMTEAVMPQHSNSMGITFGGNVMRWMELAGSIAASRHARSICVTASVDEMSFVKSSKVGDLLIFRAQVNRVFNTSMEVGVRVEAYSRGSATAVHCNSGYITFLAVDQRSVKRLKETADLASSPAASRVRVRQVVPTRDVDKKRWLLAAERRKRRLAFRAKAQAAAEVAEARQREQREKENEESLALAYSLGSSSVLSS